MSTKKKEKGVSVIICCYNSSDRIQKTLEALAEQSFNAPIQWEIILVDNASTDNTNEKANTIWANLNTGISLKMLFESKPGQANARMKGIKHASYSIILFCDDDNWLCPEYIQGAFDILENDFCIAACGGKGIPIFETLQPKWFANYSEAFAVGSQEINIENGRILNLYGAGIAIRKEIIEQLYQSGFKPQMQGRTGNKLSSADDIELTYAFILMGYKLYYDERLSFCHYLPKERLTFDYLKKLFVAFGADGPVRNLYYAIISARFTHKGIRNWNYHFALSMFRLLKYLIAPPKKNGRAIYLNWNLSYIRELLAIKKEYTVILKNILKIKGIPRLKPYGPVTSYEVLTNEYKY